MAKAGYVFEMPSFKSKAREQKSKIIVKKNAKKSVKPIRSRERVAIIVDEEGNCLSEIPLAEYPLKRVMSTAREYGQRSEKTVWVYIAKKKYEIPYELDFKEDWDD